MAKIWIILGIFLGLALSLKGAMANAPTASNVIDAQAVASIAIDPHVVPTRPGEQSMCVQQKHFNAINAPEEKYVVCLDYTTDEAKNAHIFYATIQKADGVDAPKVEAKGFFNVNEPSELCHHLNYRRALVKFDQAKLITHKRIHDDNAFESAPGNTHLKTSPFWYQEENTDDAFYAISELVCLN